MEKLIMYTLPLCPICFQAKQFLKNKGVAFEEKKVIHSSVFKEMRKITNSLRVPVMKVGDEVLSGFNRKKYQQAFSSYDINHPEKE
ncbi:glutaredoxin [Syntrophobotulus glycolicus DSM 8271]|uniref:Glutaredoxin n=1 Tax=Syntrophobotulus glycolicus (strain DSM 8271 / FlGlyR) TaxID=645991 RepID=F0SX94_SYNGF|nr:glutaredoxin family protein [Syntrophobotulus glycolicus]ADY56954.1 glutaredoxin [Syntrophobotulus glycolicus DSM 8271]